MPERQLRLFAHPKPLLERFGEDFFKSVPPKPGVYLMFGGSERLLYVGQTSNLRSRLGTYKNCNPNHTPRKVQRLVHQVDRIVWELCEDATHARLRENELLRQHRPKFNAVNTYPKRYFFIGFNHTGRRSRGDAADVLRLWLTNEPSTAEPLFGAFKGHTRAAFNALAMLLWSYANAPESHYDFPVGMLNGRLSRKIDIPICHAKRDAASLGVPEYLAGTSDKLLDQLLPAVPSAPAIHRALHEEALLTLAQFYEAGPLRTRRLREQYESESAFMLQDRLDDLIVLARGC